MNPEQDYRFEESSRKERPILNYIIQGYTNKEIGYMLGITENTVKNHVSTILSKMHAKNRTHAAYMYVQMILSEGGTIPNRSNSIKRKIRVILRRLFGI